MRRRSRGNGEGSIFKRQDGGPWYISWYAADGKRKTHCTRTTCKTTAQRILADKLADVALRREGIIDTRQDAIITEAGKDIETHLTDFEAMMHARQRSARHIRSTMFLLREVCTAAAFQKPSDISADGLNRIAADIKAKGQSTRTVQARVVAMKAFTRWLADHGKLLHDPLRCVKRPSVNADRKVRRRMLTPTEWPYLRAATFTNGPRDGMNPLERVALYALAIQSGLRQNELRSLTKADLYLAVERPYVRCRAENTKNGQEARQYVQADLATELRAIVANKMPTANVFTMPDEFHVAQMLRGDLAAARQQWLDEVKHDADARAKRAESDFLAVANHAGEILDFHALRHTCGSWLALQGVHPNVVKTVMRHSTITLTMDTYGHLLPDQHSEAVGGMSAMMTGELRAAVGAAVGVQNGATACDAVRGDEEKAEMRQTLEFKPKSASRKAKDESASCRARTYDPLIKRRPLQSKNIGFLALVWLKRTVSRTDLAKDLAKNATETQ